LRVLSRILIVSLMLLISLNSFGADNDSLSSRMALRVNMHHGFLIAHRPSMITMQQKHANAIEANIIMRTDGRHNWERLYAYPEIGVSVSVWDLGNESRLGKGFTAVPYIDFPLVYGNKTSFDLKFGWGLGYIEKRFDPDDNYKNIAIGSHINCVILIQPQFKYDLTHNVSLGAGLSLTHFSNGSYITPNLGINMASVVGSVSVGFGKKFSYNKSPLREFQKSRRISFYAAGSVKQVYPVGGPDYFAGILSGNWSKQFSRKSAYGIGIDLFYDESIYKKLEERNLTLDNSFQKFRAGLHGSYELTISDLSFTLNMGTYLYTKLKNDGKIYHRIGLRYRLNNNIFMCLNLKTHWGKADFMELGFGYLLEKIYK
jgi:hypothetical protein